MRTATLNISTPAVAAPTVLHDGLSKISSLLADGFNTLMRWQRHYDQRQHLRELDSRLIADAGLTQDIIRREIAKPFWQN
jgi:uncharacterized protein YjiS (DUF1127 family)